MIKSFKHILIAGAALGGGFVATPALASCNDQPFLGAVCVLATNFCPRSYMDADGRLLSIAQHTALFSLLGTTFGGNGQTTFGLPDLRGRSAVGVGQGPGLSPQQEGETGGQELVSLNLNQLPAHTHTAAVTDRGTSSAGNTDNPAGAVPARLARSNIYHSGAADAVMGAATTVSVGTAGQGQPVSVRSPYLGLRHCIAVEGIYPSRN